jgi:predicted GIY-YIG superfamily endonuclease
VPASVLLDAARRAPAGPGVYLFVGSDHDLLYVGKAANLRRRLQGHARAPSGIDLRSDARVDRVTAVGWEECATEREALLREADLIAALRPPYNASQAHGPVATFVTLEDDGGTPGAVTFGLAVAAPTPPGKVAVYGSFPHLAKGGASSPAKWTKRGYTALLRLLWAAQGTPRAAHIPRGLAGASPPVRATVPMDHGLRPALHRFLTGRSGRLLDELRPAVTGGAVPAYMHPRLLADLDDAGEFYEIGPRRLAAFRRRHQLPPPPIEAGTTSSALLDDMRVVLGDPQLDVGRKKAK